MNAPGAWTAWPGRVQVALTVALALVLSTVGLFHDARAAAAATTSSIVTSPGCHAHQVARNDDGSSAAVSLPFILNFYGKKQSKIYVNNNGNVTFDAPLSTFTPFVITADTPPIIAPFFADVDTRPSTSGITSYGVTTFGGRPAFCVNWRRVGYYNSRVDKRNDFQLLLVNSNSSGDFDIVFNYGSVTWETGSASGGVNGFGGTPAGAGFSNGDGNLAHFVQLAGSLQAGAFLNGALNTALSTTSNLTPAVPGRYVFHIASGNQVSEINVCPKFNFVSVRGSGISSTGVDDRKADATTAAVFDNMLGKYQENGGSASDVKFYQIPYQALSTDVLTRGLGEGSFQDRQDKFFEENLPTYLASVEDGLEQLSGYVQSVTRVCAAQQKVPKFLLSGYSQGALVIHRYLDQISDDNLLRTHVKFAALIADPAAVPNSTVFNWGTVTDPADYGICPEAKAFTSADLCSTGDRDIPSAFTSITQHLCDLNDLVCNTSRSLGINPFTLKAEAEYGALVHTTYTSRSSDDLANMGRSMYQKGMR